MFLLQFKEKSEAKPPGGRAPRKKRTRPDPSADREEVDDGDDDDDVDDDGPCAAGN